MPVMNGARTAQYVRMISPKTRIVFLSIYDVASATSDLMKMTNADGFVSKTGDPDALFQTIDSLFKSYETRSH